MKTLEHEDLLLELSPGDLGTGLESKIRDLQASGEVNRGDIDAEIRYLRAISARKVQLPSDAYFARVRERIYSQVNIRPVSVWARLSAAILPETIKPIPAIITGTAAVLLIAIITSMIYFSPMRKTEKQFAYGPHMSIGQTYTEHVVALDNSAVSQEDLIKLKEILVMSTAILGSPSSLSRSQALLGGSSRL